MTRIPIVLVALSSFLVAERAGATPLVPRIHFLTQKVEKRLSRGARRVSQGTALLKRPNGWGTAFVVGRTKRTALLLTAEHCNARDGKVVFHSGGQEFTATATRVIASSHKLDYTLFEVDIPRKMPRLRPLSIGLSSPGPMRPVYSVSYPGLDHIVNERLGIPLNQRIAASPLERMSINLQQRVSPTPKKTIQSAVVLQSNDADPRMAARRSFSTNLPSNVGGASGAAVVDSKTHQVLGLEWGGSWGEVPVRTPGMTKPVNKPVPVVGATPMRTILSDLARQAAEGSVDRAALRPLRKQLKQVSPGTSW